MILLEVTTGNIIAILISALVIGYIFFNFFAVRKRMNRPPSENIKILDDRNFGQVVGKGVSLVDFGLNGVDHVKCRDPSWMNSRMKWAKKQIFANWMWIKTRIRLANTAFKTFRLC